MLCCRRGFESPQPFLDPTHPGLDNTQEDMHSAWLFVDAHEMPPAPVLIAWILANFDAYDAVEFHEGPILIRKPILRLSQLLSVRDR